MYVTQQPSQPECLLAQGSFFWEVNIYVSIHNSLYVHTECIICKHRICSVYVQSTVSKLARMSTRAKMLCLGGEYTYINREHSMYIQNVFYIHSLCRLTTRSCIYNAFMYIECILLYTVHNALYIYTECVLWGGYDQQPP